MPRQIVLGMGAGQCGFHLLMELLRQQKDSNFTFEQAPVLPWKLREGWPGVAERIERWKSSRSEQLIGDVAAFYLPYVVQAIECEPSIRIVCLKRSRAEVIDGFCRHLDLKSKVPINHWSIKPQDGWTHDPIWSQAFPQYETPDRETALGLYWDEYYERATALADKYSENFLLIEADELSDKSGVRRVLDSIGIPEDQQNVVVGGRLKSTVNEPRPKLPLRGPMDPSKCVILVPYNGAIHAECEEPLKELERRGYVVRRVGGYAAIDQGRNQMVTDALMDGFEETMWIDSDVGFHPDDIDRLRSHQLAIVSGIYPQKGKRALASHIIPGTRNMTFGTAGGVVELLYAATGFLLVRRQAYLEIQEKLALPVCNERFGRPLLPFFLPMLHAIEDGHWYLAEDYSFSERARRSGIKIHADTRIRLWHVGTYRYGWEDAGIERPRFDTFTLNFDTPEKNGRPTVDPLQEAINRFAGQFSWPRERPSVPKPPERNWLYPGTRRALAETVPQNARLIIDVGSWLGRSARYLCDLAPKARVVAVDHWRETQEQAQDPDLVPLLPRLYETFLAESWEYRERIIPLRTSSIEGMQKIAAAGLVPDVIYLDADHAYESVFADLSIALGLFPSAAIVGDDWDCEGVRRAVQTVADDRKLRVELFDTGWRILR